MLVGLDDLVPIRPGDPVGVVAVRVRMGFGFSRWGGAFLLVGRSDAQNLPIAFGGAPHVASERAFLSRKFEGIYWFMFASYEWETPSASLALRTQSGARFSSTSPSGLPFFRSAR